jgi:mannose-6-phosphate isomerase-like protein (cupin superfamily)
VEDRRPVVERFEPRDLGEKPWGREILVAHTDQYTGKVLLMKAGWGGHLQYHMFKDEAFFVYGGTALLKWTTPDGELHEQEISDGAAYHIPPGAGHQVVAITDLVLFEVSTPVFDDRVIIAPFEGPAR